MELNLLQTAFLQYSEILLARLKTSLLERDQMRIIGETREDYFQEFLREVLPSRFGVSTGFVVSHDGQRSDQQDVIIYEHIATPVLQPGARFPIHLVESVHVVVEVKTELDKGELKDCVQKARSVKSLKKTGIVPGWYVGEHAVTPPVLGTAFARSARPSIKSLTENLHKFNQEAGKGQELDLICILEPPAIIGRFRVDGRHMTLDPANGIELAYTTYGPNGSEPNDPSGVLMMFCLTLFNFLNRRITVPPDLFVYADKSGSVPIKWLWNP